MVEAAGLREALARIKSELGSSGTLMGFLVDMIIVSEVWRENGKLHIVAWIPDIDPARHTLTYRRKHIVYDEAAGRILEMRHTADEG